MKSQPSAALDFLCAQYIHCIIWGLCPMVTLGLCSQLNRILQTSSTSGGSDTIAWTVYQHNMMASESENLIQYCAWESALPAVRIGETVFASPCEACAHRTVSGFFNALNAQEETTAISHTSTSIICKHPRGRSMFTASFYACT